MQKIIILKCILHKQVQPPLLQDTRNRKSHWSAAHPLNTLNK